MTLMYIEFTRTVCIYFTASPHLSLCVGGRQADRQADRPTDIQKERQADRQTNRDTDIQADSYNAVCIYFTANPLLTL